MRRQSALILALARGIRFVYIIIIIIKLGGNHLYLSKVKPKACLEQGKSLIYQIKTRYLTYGRNSLLFIQDKLKGNFESGAIPQSFTRFAAT